jgi:6-phosphogluconolactonase
VVKELSGEVSAYRFEDKKATFIQTTSIDSIDIGADKGSADIHVSPDGKFLYVSNRGKSNNIAICQVDDAGALKLIGFQSVLGVQPRNFVITPNGDYLLAANQATSNIVVFKRDKITGLLTPNGNQIMQKIPTCLIFE